MSHPLPGTLAIRADASQSIGTGHVFRCLALADEARALGARVVFVCRELPGHLGGMLAEKGYQVRMIDGVSDGRDDAAATRAALTDLASPVDWLIVDHYGLDVQWERVLRPLVRHLAAMDDLADRPHDVDLLIDSCHGAEERHLYDGLVPSHALRAVGQDFVLLRREFFETEPPARCAGEVRRILVTLGGSDPLGGSELALDALDCPQFASIPVDLVLGAVNPRPEALRRRAGSMRNVTVHVQHNRMAHLMAGADLCIGAGGTTSWERCYMGLPSVILVLADNQRGLASRLERLKCGRALDVMAGIDAAALRIALRDILHDARWRAEAGLRARALVDGKGVSRVLKLLEGALRQRGPVSAPCSTDPAQLAGVSV